jgi:predicted DNA-binding transcriptional regulator AlpA
MTTGIERKDAAQQRLGVKRSFFWANYVHHSEDDPYLPGTTIPRLKPVQLGLRAIGFFTDEIDALLEALRALRDSGQAPPRTLPRTASRPQRPRQTCSVARGARR